MIKYAILSLGLFMVSSGLTSAAEVVSIDQQPTSHGKLNGKVELPDSEGDMMSSQDPAKAIEELSKKNDFFKLTVQSEDIYNRGEYEKAALYFIACALDPEMGEMHQDTLHTINPESLGWVESYNFGKLATMLPKLEEHLQNRHLEQKSAKKAKPDMVLSQESEESFTEIQ